MLKIDNNYNATLTRGDTLTMTLDLYQDNGEPYEMDENDYLQFVLYAVDRYVSELKPAKSYGCEHIQRNAADHGHNYKFKMREVGRWNGERMSNVVAVDSNATALWTSEEYQYSIKLINQAEAEGDSTNIAYVNTIIDLAGLTVVE